MRGDPVLSFAYCVLLPAFIGWLNVFWWQRVRNSENQTLLAILAVCEFTFAGILSWWLWVMVWAGPQIAAGLSRGAISDPTALMIESAISHIGWFANAIVAVVIGVMYTARYFSVASDTSAESNRM